MLLNQLCVVNLGFIQDLKRRKKLSGLRSNNAKQSADCAFGQLLANATGLAYSCLKPNLSFKIETTQPWDMSMAYTITPHYQSSIDLQHIVVFFNCFPFVQKFMQFLSLMAVNDKLNGGTCSKLDSCQLTDGHWGSSVAFQVNGGKFKKPLIDQPFYSTKPFMTRIPKQSK